MNTEEIRNIAIKRHDIDADDFQAAYSSDTAAFKNLNVFRYGRDMIIEELELILSTLPKGSKVLDVGCGTAHLTKWIQDKGFEVYGIEPSEKMLALAKKNFPGMELKQAISSDIPYTANYFDLVIAIEVLRYLDEKENISTLKEFNRVLKNGGSFFVTQVNLFSTDFYFVFHHLKGFFRKKDQYHPHCNFTTFFRQQKIARLAGFTDIKTVGRMAGSLRVFYKFDNAVGNLCKNVAEKLGRQRRTSFFKLFAGHLIVMGKKPQAGKE